MNDTETFELCKEVYKRTGWRAGIETWLGNGDPTWIKRVSNSMDNPSLNHNDVPLYTSDYLLEKILPITNISFVLQSDGKVYLMWSPELPDYKSIYGSTSLEALLQLVIRLDDAGELPHE